MPYNTHKEQPIQENVYVSHDSPDISRVLIDFITWGKNAIVVQKPHA